MLKIYNSLTKQKEVFVPIEEGKVKMYICGPTVYNFIHIGNARPIIFFDTVRNYLEYLGYNVNYVSNFTDVDDKIIKASLEKNIDTKTLTETFIKEYFDDILALGCRKASHHPKVTDHIDPIITFIANLISKGFAYESNGDVYFRTKKFENYGDLSKQSIEDLKLGSRVEVNQNKEDDLDFVLWKKAKEKEVFWSSPWGNGRPGWHIECSVMAKEHLGETIDIHAGGQDLAFPHHENEIAQSEAHNDKKFANYWMHNAFVNIDDKKMSKSLGNDLTVNKIRQQIDPQIVRFFMLSVHYRQPINYGSKLLEDAENSLKRILNSYKNLKHRLSVTSQKTKNSSSWTSKIENTVSDFKNAMNDDFNTANAISSFFSLANDTNIFLEEEFVSTEEISLFLSTFEDFSKILGITLSTESSLEENIELLIEERLEARKSKNFALADEIRNKLFEMGIILEDTPHGTRWSKK